MKNERKQEKPRSGTDYEKPRMKNNGKIRKVVGSTSGLLM